MKSDGHLGRNYLKGHHADLILTAVGYNFRLILNWLSALLRMILAVVFEALMPRSAAKVAS